MKLKVLRYSDNGKSTLGMLFVDGYFVCYTIEDTHREEKVYGETRIPNRTYDLGLRTVGGFHAKHLRRYKDKHKGMLHVLDVPNFKYILIHSGNNAEDTKGCLLVGDTTNNNTITKGVIEYSRQAYERLYDIVISEVLKGRVTIEYTS